MKMETFRNWYEHRHEYARDWKQRTSGKVIGTFCTYVPEEILVAANILPVRILGSHEPQDVTEPHIFGMFCPFCRDALAQGLKGRFNYLNGVVLAHSCIHFRQTFNSWRIHLPVDFSYYIPMPNTVQTPHNRAYHKSEVEKFKDAVEKYIGRPITEQNLDRGIEVLNRNRRLLRKVYEYRKLDDPPLTGEEAMYVAVTSQFIDKEEHSDALEAVLKQLPNRKLSREPGIRLMAVGSENDDAEFFRMVEAVGGTVVIDEQCAGSRYFWNESVPNGDGLAVIANRYLDRPPCPVKDYPSHSRFQHVLNLAKDYRAQGAIIMQEKFCDPHEGDNPRLKKYLEENGIPTLSLEFDSTNPLGPFRIRVEAFLETIRGEELF
jgi:benzoyl-CoA reductase subunit C